MYYSKINKITNKCYINSIATLAQPVEQCFRKAEVPSSNLGGGSKGKEQLLLLFFEILQFLFYAVGIAP